MSNLVVSLDPKNIIQQNSHAAENYLTNHFMEVIAKLYQYEMFKPMMDLVASKAYERRLQFKITPKEMHHLDEGNCKTIESGTFNKILNRILAKKEYTITIRKITPDVIIHEIGHMVEKETNLELTTGFRDSITNDIKSRSYNNVSLGAAINSVLIKEVAAYPIMQIGSELFTRYFQLLAMAKEVSGKAAEYAFNLTEVYKAFPATELWIFNYLYPKLTPHFNTDIVAASRKYITPIDEIKHKWSDEKIRSFHKNGKEKTNWTHSIKSIKDD
jgi:hypothetical protein